MGILLQSHVEVNIQKNQDLGKNGEILCRKFKNRGKGKGIFLRKMIKFIRKATLVPPFRGLPSEVRLGVVSNLIFYR